MPDQFNIPTAHDIAKKLLEGPDLPLFDRHSEFRVIDVSTCERYNRVRYEDMDEHGNPCFTKPDHIYYYLVHKDDPDHIKWDLFPVRIASFGYRNFAVEYLKTQPDNTWVIREISEEGLSKLYESARVTVK
jgi:hypothetical protein